MNRESSETDWPVWRVLLLYLALSIPYILFSDWLVHALFGGQALESQINSLKGLVFVLLTTLLIGYLLHRELASRAKTEAALRESEARYRRLAENVPDALYRFRLTEPAGLDYVSPAITAMTGFTPDELYQHPEILSGNVHPDDLGLYQSAENRFVVELRVRGKDGRIVWLEMRHVPVFDTSGVLVAMEGIARDVTRQREGQMALRLQSAALDAAADAIVITDQSGTIEWVNEAYTQLTGFAKAEARGQNPRSQKSGAQDRAFYEKMWGDILAGKVWRGQLINRRKDGSLYTEEETITPVRGAGAEVTHFVAVKHDITDRVRYEQELEVIAQISAALRSASSRPEMLAVVAAQVRSIMGVADAAFVLPGDWQAELRVELGQGPLAGPRTGERLVRSACRSGDILESGQPFVSADVTADPRDVHPPDWPAGLAAAGVPLTAGTETIGVMWAYRSSSFSAEEVGRLRVIADFTAAALQRMIFLDQAQRRTEQLAILNELGNTLVETFEMPEILERLSSTVRRLLPDIGVLFVSLYNADTRQFTAAYALKDGEMLDTGQLPPVDLLPPGVGTQSEVIYTGRPLIVNELEKRLTTVPAVALVGSPGEMTQSALYVPLKAKGAIVGVLQVQSYMPDRFMPADAELLSLAGNTAAIAIQNARLFADNLERLDTLTSLYVGAQKLSFSRDLSQLTADVVRTCVEGYSTQAAWLGRTLPGGAIERLAFYPQTNSSLAALATERDESEQAETPTGAAIRTGYAVVLNDILADREGAGWRELATSQGWRSAIVLPLISRDDAVGVLCLFSQEPGFFNSRRQSFLQAYSHLVAAALENARLSAETGRRLLQLQSLRAIDSAITGSLDLRLNLKIILDQVTSQLGSDAADLLILNRSTLQLEFAAGRGFTGPARPGLNLQVGQGFAGQVALTRSLVSVPQLAAAPANEQTRVLQAEGFESYYGAPLIAKGQVIGVMEIYHRRPLLPDEEWFEFLRALAEQSAIAIDNASLFENLQRSNLELALAYDATIEGWSRALDLRDRETEGHTQRVTDLSTALAQRMGLPGEDLVQLRRGALLHDIGKMGVPDSILLKPGPLTDEEWQVMRRHPVYAYEMLSPITYLRPALHIPYCHHEKWDGTGYPRGLKGQEIPLAARIFAIVDVWDAVRSDRPYRLAWPEDKARDYIRSLTGTHFDPMVVDAFLGLL